MTYTPPGPTPSSSNDMDRAQRITEQLSSLGLNFDASTGSVVPGDGVDVDSLPSSVAMNGAADGQGRFYASDEFETILSQCDKLTSSPAADEKRPFAESYSAREKLEEARVNIETKRCLAMLDGATPRETLQEAQGQVARLEYRLGSIALSCEEGSLKALDHLVGGAMPYFFGTEVANLVEKLGSTGADSPAESASVSLPRPLQTTLPVNEAVDLLNTAGAANANRENFGLSVELLLAADQVSFSEIQIKTGDELTWGCAHANTHRPLIVVAIRSFTRPHRPSRAKRWSGSTPRLCSTWPRPTGTSAMRATPRCTAPRRPTDNSSSTSPFPEIIILIRSR